MKIFNDVKNFYKKPDEFVMNNTKTVFLYSTALKIIALSYLIIQTFFPIYLAIISLSLFSISLYIDYKLFSNAKELIFLTFQKNINKDPYQASFFLGRLIGVSLKTNFKQRICGFYAGFKKEFFK